MLRNRATLDRLVREHLPEALRFAIRLTGSLDEAEDIVQDAMLKAVRGWHLFRGQSSFRTWLFRIVINAFRDRVARSDTRLDANETLVDPRQGDPREIMEAQELGDAVVRFVTKLPVRQREVFVMSTFLQSTPTEVAETLGISVDNVNTNLHVARRRLKQMIDRHFAQA